MSTRRVDPQVAYVNALRRELAELKQAAIAKEPMETKDVTINTTADTAHTVTKVDFDDLTPTEQAAASLGAQPDAYRPIGWMNEAHFNNLLTSNSLSNDLARRLMAYKTVASAGNSP
jgi:hypothetical protein